MQSLTIPPKNYVYGVKFNTYIKKYKNEILILLWNNDNKIIFNFVSNIWYQIIINNEINFQIITIPSESKVYYDGKNYYTDNINIKKRKHFYDILYDPYYTEDIIKNYGMAIEYIHPIDRTNQLCQFAIKNNINSIIHCYMYDKLDKELYKHPHFIKEMIDYIPMEMIEKLQNKKRLKKYLENI